MVLRRHIATVTARIIIPGAEAERPAAIRGSVPARAFARPPYLPVTGGAATFLQVITVAAAAAVVVVAVPPATEEATVEDPVDHEVGELGRKEGPFWESSPPTGLFFSLTTHYIMYSQFLSIA